MAHNVAGQPTTYVDADGFQLVPTKKASPSKGHTVKQTVDTVNSFTQLLTEKPDREVAPVNESVQADSGKG